MFRRLLTWITVVVAAVIFTVAVVFAVIEYWENLNRLPPSWIDKHATPATTLYTAAIGLALILAMQVESRMHEESNAKGTTGVGTAADSDVAPDVMLRLDTIRQTDKADEDAPISVYNAGSDMAMHIEIDPIETGEYKIGDNFAGDNMDAKPVSPILSSTTMVFSQVPDLPEKQSGDTTLRLDSASIQFAMMTAVKLQLGLWWFIDHVYEHKWHEEQRYGAVTDQNREGAEAAVKRMPIQVPLRITFWNSAQTEQWERIETLHYDPSNRRAYVEHGRSAKLTKDGVAQTSRVLTDVGKALIVHRTKRLLEHCEILQKRYITLGVAYSQTSPDAETFAKQVAAACTDAGFRVRGIAALDFKESKQFPGIWVRKVPTWGTAQDPPLDEALKRALDDGGNKAQISWSDTYAQTTFEVIVGD